MTAKYAVAAALMPLCFVPVAFVAHANQVRLFAFEGVETRIERACTRADIAALLPRPTVEIVALTPAAAAEPAAVGATAAGGTQAEVNAAAGGTRAAARRAANGKNIPSRGCNDWRPLNAGPTSLAATVGPVRVCEGSPPERGQPAGRVAAQSTRSKLRARGTKRSAEMSFEFDLRDPR
jgi:hypothetical protein